MNASRESTRASRAIPVARAPSAVRKASLLTDLDRKRLLDSLSQLLTFSFRYLDLAHEVFDCRQIRKEWHVLLLERLQAASQLNFTQLALRGHFRVHAHGWDKLKYRFRLPADVWDQVQDDCFQIRFGRSEGGIHGFLVDEGIFFVVWLDPDHKLYPRQT